MKRVFIGFFFLILAQMAMAQNQLGFLSRTDFNVATFPAPPSEDSFDSRQDIEVVLQFQRERTADRCAQAAKEVGLTLDSIFGGQVGPLTKEELRLVRPLWGKIFQDTDYFVNSIKRRWKRLRPFQRSKDVKPCIPPHASTSYPSGHAAISRAAALAFAEVFPEKAQALMLRSEEAALSRVIGGVHHPIDTRAGQSLAQQLYEIMKTKEEFSLLIQKLQSQRKK